MCKCRHSLCITEVQCSVVLCSGWQTTSAVFDPTIYLGCSHSHRSKGSIVWLMMLLDSDAGRKPQLPQHLLLLQATRILSQLGTVMYTWVPATNILETHSVWLAMLLDSKLPQHLLLLPATCIAHFVLLTRFTCPVSAPG